MEKLKLFGVTKAPTHVVYNIEKKQLFLEYFREFLHTLDFSKVESAKLLSLLGDSDDNYSARSYSDKLYQDVYFYFEKMSIDWMYFLVKQELLYRFSLKKTGSKN